MNPIRNLDISVDGVGCVEVGPDDCAEVVKWLR